MRSSLEVAFADTVAELNQCAESVRRFPDPATRAKVVGMVAQSVTDLFAELLSVGRPGDTGDVAVRIGPLFARVTDIEGEDGATYLVVDEDGTFREAERGQTRAAVVEDIANGEFEVEQVFRIKGPICEDVSAAVAEDVLARLRRTGPGPKPFIPALVVDHMEDEAEELRLSWMSPREIRAERDELNADRAYEEMRDRIMDAAE